ncbi:MAG: S-layer homology domain-containing protein [Ruminococcaceae bacterium]|nr:S-layer homology domain-containing protein [Oscillospiraceae bacterium]
MKKVILYTALIFVMLTCVSAIEYSSDGFYWDFSDEAQSKEWLASGGFSSFETGIYIFTSTSTDPQLKYHFIENSFEALEYPYFAYRYKAHTSKKSSALFWTNETYTVFTDVADANRLPIVPDGAWHSEIADLREAEKNDGTWSGTITSVRFDPINLCNENDYIYLSCVGFFKTEEAAKQFLNGVKETYKFDVLTTFRDNMQCSYVPAGVLKDGYDRTDYLILDTSAEGNVVMYTDENGEQRVVPLSHINKGGFISFSPNRKADYVLGTSSVQFSDIDTHWAKESIEYVSQRKIFGGTAANIFSPDMPLTNGMFVTVMGRLDGADGTTTGMYFEPYLDHVMQKGYYDGTVTDFCPEEAVTRLEVAKMLDKFISCAGYNILNNYTCNFSDISALSNSDQAAVNSICAYGIMNGRDKDNFDPYGIMTRGEAAELVENLIKSVLNVKIDSPYTDEYFRRDRIKLGTKGSFEPYFVMDTEYMNRVKDCGFDWIIATGAVSGGEIGSALLNFADKNGIEVYLTDNAHKDYSNSLEFCERPSYTGTYVFDEPGVDEMAQLAEIANDYLENTGRDPHVNLLPLYASDAQLKYGANTDKTYTSDDHYQFYYEYAKNWGELADADFMCVDIYPLKTSGTYKDYVESINLFARAARDTEKEFYAYIQSYGWTDGKRNANLRDFRFQVYSMLSFGCKGLIYWSYTSQGNYDIYSLVDKDGEPTEIYYAAQTSLQELKKLSDIYCSYDNIGAFNHNCTDATPYLKMTNPVSFPAISKINSQSPLLIGCFEAKEGDGKAFTLVNMNELLENKSADVSFKISGYTKVTAYLKGEPAVLTANDGMYSISLEPGEGVFITLDK